MNEPTAIDNETQRKIDEDIDTIINLKEDLPYDEHWAKIEKRQLLDSMVSEAVYALLKNHKPWEAGATKKFINKELKDQLKKYGINPTKENINELYEYWKLNDGIYSKKLFESREAFADRERREMVYSLKFKLGRLLNSWWDLSRDNKVFMCWDIHAGHFVDIPNDAPQELLDFKAKIGNEYPVYVNRQKK